MEPAHRAVVQQFVALLFRKYSDELELPLLLKAVIALYAGKTGREPVVKAFTHNVIVFNVVHFCWTQNALSPKQTVVVWECFLSAFEWICCFGKRQSDRLNRRDNVLAVRALSDHEALWNLMAHFLSFVLIDSSNAMQCTEMVSRLRPYIKQMLNALLFEPIFRFLSIGSNQKNGGNSGNQKLRGHADRLQKRLLSAVQRKQAVQSDIAAVKMGVNRCALQIQTQCDLMVRALKERAKRLQSELMEIERKSVDPLLRRCKEMDGVIGIWKKAQWDLDGIIGSKGLRDGDQGLDADEERATMDKLQRILKLNVDSQSDHDQKLNVKIPKFEADEMRMGQCMESLRKFGKIGNDKITGKLSMQRMDVDVDVAQRNKAKKRALKKEKKALTVARWKRMAEITALIHDVVYIHCVSSKV